MSQTGLLERVISHWTDVLNDPSIREMCDDYEALKGEPDEYDEDAQHPVDGVLESLASIDSSAETISSETAQSIFFLQQLAKTEIQALKKSTLPFRSTQEQREMIDILKMRLADIESLMPQDNMKQLSKAARNQQRIDDGEIESLNGYKNWLHGTLAEDQQSVLTALQWQTTTGPIHPVKGVVGFVDEFVNDLVAHDVRTITGPAKEGKWGSAGKLAINAVMTKLVVDSIVFMTSVTGTHQIVKDRAAEASDIMKQEGNVEAARDLLDDFLGGDDLIVENSANYDSSQTISVDAQAIAEARCLEKIDTDWNLIGATVENVEFLKCETIREGLQNWFTVVTATPRTLQDGQKGFSEIVMQEGTLAAESYNHHHENASLMIENIAYADNALHVILLGAGAIHAGKLYSKHGADTHKQLWRGLKQQGHLAKKRPLTLGGAAAGWATYSATHGGEIVNIEMAPYLVVGALLGYGAQRAYVGYKENQKFIFNLHADAPKIPDNTHIPFTSIDQKPKHHLRNMFLTYAATGATIVTASNTGVVSESSPEVIQSLTDLYMGSAAFGGALTSWAAFDKLDDVLYHKTFYGTPLAVLFSTCVMADAAKRTFDSIPGSSHVKKAWKKASRFGKETLAATLLATNVALDPGMDDPNPVYVREDSRVHMVVSEPVHPTGTI